MLKLGKSFVEVDMNSDQEQNLLVYGYTPKRRNRMVRLEECTVGSDKDYKFTSNEWIESKELQYGEIVYDYKETNENWIVVEVKEEI